MSTEKHSNTKQTHKLTQNYFLPDQPGRLVELEGGDPGDVDWDVHHCRWQ